MCQILINKIMIKFLSFFHINDIYSNLIHISILIDLFKSQILILKKVEKLFCFSITLNIYLVQLTCYNDERKYIYSFPPLKIVINQIVEFCFFFFNYKKEII